MNYGAVYNEYEQKYYWWGFVLMALKLMLMYISSILYDDIKTKALSAFCVLYIYYYAFKSTRPFVKVELFWVERTCLIAYLVNILGSLYYNNNEVEFL